MKFNEYSNSLLNFIDINLILEMQKHQTQQFAKFFLKDLKIKSSRNDNHEVIVDELNFDQQTNFLSSP